MTGGQPGVRVLGRDVARCGARTVTVDTGEARVYLTLGDDLTAELIGCAGKGTVAAALRGPVARTGFFRMT